MAVEIEVLADLVHVRLLGDIDHHSAKQMREEIDAAVTRSGARELRLDFREVSFMDSSGIGLVMGRYKLMQELGGTLHVINIARNLKKVMILAGLDRLAVLDGDVRRSGADNGPAAEQNASPEDLEKETAQ